MVHSKNANASVKQVDCFLTESKFTTVLKLDWEQVIPHLLDVLKFNISKDATTSLTYRGIK
jgi:Cft2 family RNA processing exonuclease